MIVIVGHGPSILSRRIGAWIDGQTVVRLKTAPIPDPDFCGSRTNYIFSRQYRFLLPIRPQVEYLLFVPNQYREHHEGMKARYADDLKWEAWYRQFSTKKISTGLCAICTVIDLMQPKEIGLLGFDAVLGGKNDSAGNKWFDDRRPWLSHDPCGEKRALESLGVEIVNLADHGRIPEATGTPSSAV